MLDQIESEMRYAATYIGKDTLDERVMTAMAEVPREKFVPAELQPFAYDNGPLSIGYGQTISQPFIVALMTDFLQLTPDSIVLEIGTGSGYQTAILSTLAKKVYTIERIPELSEAAAKRLKEQGYDKIETRSLNGHMGWEEKGPFDAIIVTAAASHIPPALVAQLKPGGRMVIPVGPAYGHQELILVVKEPDGTTRTQSLLDVAFVPLVKNNAENESRE